MTKKLNVYLGFVLGNGLLLLNNRFYFSVASIYCPLRRKTEPENRLDPIRTL